MTIGDRIRIRRKEIGLSVDQLADRIGKNRATIYRYESNEIEKYPLEILEPLAQALCTTPASLMGWSEEKISSNKSLSEFHQRALAQLEKMNDEQIKAVLAFINSLDDIEKSFSSDSNSDE